jgi:gamma-glutamyl-gamma-aminobutyraldehyde dehydrogenase
VSIHDKSLDDWERESAGLTFRTRAFINGSFCSAQSGEVMACVNPATGDVIAEIASCGPDDVDHAVRSARSSFEDGRWSRSAPSDRKAVLLKLAELIRENAVELALLDSLDMGKLVKDAVSIDVPGAAGVFQWYAEAIDKLYGEVAPTAPGNLAVVEREPLGVIGAVVPWNFPLDMAAWKCAPALAAGNSVVLKPAEQSSLSALRLAELAAEAGLPDGALNVVPGRGEIAGRALGLHADVDCIAFTGSTPVGKMFLGYASASNMKQVWLECGGKSPNIVFADVSDLAAAADAAVAGIFFNQGEVCSANSRLLVQRQILEPLVELICARADSYKPGNPLDPASGMGAIVDETQTNRVMAYIEAAKGTSRLRKGGTRVTVGGKGCFIEPTVFVDVDPRDAIAREEVFGPVLAIVPFDTEDEAVRIANDSSFGLAASLWTADLSRALRVSKRLHAGTVSVNCMDALSPQTPFGGFKQSGYGRDLSLHALDKFTGLKTTWIKF